MMSKPVQRSQCAERVVVEVETSPGSAAFRVDERLRANEVVLGSDDTISSARISVRLDDSFDVFEARRRYHAELRLLVRTDHADPAERVMLFDGYPPRQTTRWDGLNGGAQWEFAFEAEHAYERLTRLRETQIIGRRVRNGAIEDGLAADPDAWADQSALMTALPCVFNLDGQPNCAPTPLMVTPPSGAARSVSLFTYDGDVNAIAWTFANALRYLVWFYTPSEGPVAEGNIFTATDAYVALTPDDRESLGRDDPLGRALLRAPESLVCEATNLVEALALVADAAGVHITAETVNHDGRPHTQLRLWSPQAGSIRQLALARGGVDDAGTQRYDARAKRPDEILDDNDTYRAEVTWDHGGIVNAPIVVGDVKRYEMTVELVPGWFPVADLDNVPEANRAAAKALALTPEQVEAEGAGAADNAWFRKHHRRGSDFKFYPHVARRWVLNEDGRYWPTLCNRNAPFDDYKPFDFSTVTERTVTTRGAWMRRARRFEPSVTRVVEGHGHGVWVELSFDAGATWHQQASGVRVLDDQCGIIFEAENPTEITPPGTDPREQNLWYAIIDQTLRVRVTAVIESDERLIAEVSPDGCPAPTLQVWSQVAHRPDAFEFVSRLHTTNALVGVNAYAPDLGRDDTEAARALAEEMAETMQDRRVHATPAIPWIDTGYTIGDRIAGIRGQGISLATTVGAVPRYPSVVGKRYRLAGGRYETELLLERTEVKG